ncbi:hypothetical protein [Paradevosia shaoguanensis]|uniref:Uncharacterized protein n=1 Tax=Paradevosia shaoguanensis TaxID=1335043 RepID=A0AA41QP31_9HYPH|nr:hypothetical protein [Paradevosia shaoguanensis]MCF1743607.1 hypothetical protein [Paradevosia shaoguanensis]MCI0128090.1 hypothetical protein [Paradevosia shaoguanensis]
MVFDREAGEHLRELVKQHFLWVAYSIENRRVIEEIWQGLPEYEPWPIATIGVPEYENPNRRLEMEHSLDSALGHIPIANRIVFLGVGEEDLSFVDGLMAEREFRRESPATYGRYVRVVPVEKT